NLMSLVVSGPQSLDELQELVEMRFSDIANFQATAFIDEVPLFTADKLPLQLEIQTLRQQRSVHYSSLSIPFVNIGAVNRSTLSQVCLATKVKEVCLLCSKKQNWLPV
ncbi:MAG: hypothetical protein LRY63_11105, partial [Nitrincola sp.]|nr:hypothetical protein [Nitrincola sp.]